MGQTEVLEAQDHPALEWPARLGLLAYGVVYLLVGWLSAQLAFGDNEGRPSGDGALHQLADQPLGAALLWVVAVGLAALAVWEVCQAIVGHRADDGVRRLAARAGSAGRAVVMATLAVLAVKTALGDSRSSGEKGTTAKVMELPLGPALVVAIGVGIGVVGLVSIYKGLGNRWRKGLEIKGQTGEIGSVVEALARTGFLTRGVAFVVIAGLFGWAGVTHDPGKSGGLDQAIKRFRDESFGPWLILVVAVGLACYGAFHVFRAWYLRGAGGPAVTEPRRRARR